MTFHSNVRYFSHSPNVEIGNHSAETFYFYGSEELKFPSGWYAQDVDNFIFYGPFKTESDAVLVGLTEGVFSFSEFFECNEEKQDVEDGFFRLVQMSVGDAEDLEIVRGGEGAIREVLKHYIPIVPEGFGREEVSNPSKKDRVYTGLWFECLKGEESSNYARKFRVEQIRGGEQVEVISLVG